MGLMGYVRSGLRQHWHVYGIVRDTSPDAYTPTLGFATQVVSFTVLVFFLLIGFIFWITSLSDKKKWADREEPGTEPAHQPPEDQPSPEAVGGSLAPGTAMSASGASEPTLRT
jgi:hypothetical protein